MKTYFAKKDCPNCHGKYDPSYMECPYCGQKESDPIVIRNFGLQLPNPIWKQIVFFLLGLAGFQILGILCSLVGQSIIVATHPGASNETLLALLKSADFSLGVNSSAYLIMVVGFGFLIWKGWPKLLRSFKGWKPYVAGLVGTFAIYMMEVCWNMIATAIFQAAGIVPQSNANQAGIAQMTVISPVLCLFVFGLIGPFCEELTYRVGLFSFLSRLGKPLAYALTGLIFGLIHFGWNSLWNPAFTGQAIVEIVNLPPYIIAGIAFSLLYDKFGFAASYVGHAANNVFSLILILATQNVQPN